MKFCKCCNSEKSEDQFRPKYTRKDGSILRKTICRPCELTSRDIEKKRAKDRERMAVKRTAPETAAIVKARCDAYQKALSEKMAATWHERNTGKVCAIHWHTCEQCHVRTYRIKQAAIAETGPICGKCKIIAKNISRSGISMITKKCICPDCNISFDGKMKDQRCNACAKARRVAIRVKSKKKCDKTIQQRARKHGVYYEPVNRLKVYERDAWTCYLCGIGLVLSSTYMPNQATIDHVIPMAKGGPHTYANVRACCHRCNSLKTDSIIAAYAAAQQRVGP